jgi:undecaprenyl diphosphate synthase
MPAQHTTQPPLRHLAIIMDGNGRWARQRGLERIEGHRAGAETVRRVVEVCADLNIEYVTLYAFSTENWARPKTEVDQLMQLLQRFLRERLKDLKKNNIRLRTIGDLNRLPKPVQKQIEKVRTATANHDGGTMVLALNYGAREEILRAVKKTVDAVRQGKIAEDKITTEEFSSYLDTAGLPDPDLIIRTSGELRLSNFLMWQAAYTEFWFTDTLWPDFSKEELLQALDDFSQRKRRFGGIQDK